MTDQAIPGLPGKQDQLGFLRMALVTGLMEKSAVIAWADEFLMNSADADSDFVQLAMAGNQSTAQLVGLLSQLQGAARYDLTLKMVFALAGSRLEADPGKAGAIIEGIRLLRAEEYLPAEVRQELTELDHSLAQVRQGQLAPEALPAKLTGFLEPYTAYRKLLPPPNLPQNLKNRF